jgi:hypothetical protein
MGDQNRRDPLTRRQLRASFVAAIDGAQAANLVVPITNSRKFTYDSASPPLVDPGEDISRFYQAFAIQSSTTNGRNVQVQIKLIDGNEWEVPPTPYTSDEEAAASPGLIVPGGIFFMRLPTPGVMVRLLVTQPIAATDFKILVAMTENAERPLR